MRILHVWDQAGVSCLLALEQRKLGHEANIMYPEEISSGICEFYGFTEKKVLLNEDIDRSTPVRKTYYSLPVKLQSILRGIKRKCRSFLFLLRLRKFAGDYDIIHVHSLWISFFFIPFKKKIFHFHGDDMRYEPSFKPKMKRWMVRFFIRLYTRFNTVYVSTPDLLDEGFSNVVYIPNPVDLSHFIRTDEPRTKTALYTHSWYETGEHAWELASQLGLELTFHDRTIAENWIPHEVFPKYLSRFEVFIDRKEIPSLSKTGLEALAMGLTVVQGWDEKVMGMLDSKHHPKNVVKMVMEIYEGVLR